MKVHLFVKQGTSPSPVLRRLLEQADCVRYVTGREEVASVAEGTTLFAQDGLGDLVEKCPGTQFAKCCNYYVIKNIVNCPMRCSYCYLHTFSQDDFITVNCDINRIYRALTTMSKTRSLRVGTGEYSDSMALEAYTGYTRLLTDFAAHHPHILFEFKTKYTRAAPYANPGAAIIYGVTLEPQDTIDREEQGTASLAERIDFLCRAAEKNNQVALHFDPIVDLPGALRAGRKTMDDISRRISQEAVAYISLGGFRYSKGFAAVLLARYPGSRLLNGEFVRCRDHKYRYPREKRVHLFRQWVAMIRTVYPKAPVYLCMENAWVWQRVFHDMPSFSSHLFT